MGIVFKSNNSKVRPTVVAYICSNGSIANFADDMLHSTGNSYNGRPAWNFD